jgi:hypothetical protein
VVVGDLVGAGEAQERGIVGETPNLAARLQDLAEPGSIVVAASTRRLLGSRFRLSDLGRHGLKGFAEPIECWAVEGVSVSESRFESVRSGRLTGFVGREHELGLLMGRWKLAQHGEGQVVLLSGEPGIGKSRILSELRTRLETYGAASLRFHCSPYYVNSAFYPIIDNFERTLQFARDETAEQKLEKLEALIVGQYRHSRDDARLIAAMLSIPYEARYGAVPMTPQKFKDETLRALWIRWKRPRAGSRQCCCSRIFIGPIPPRWKPWTCSSIACATSRFSWSSPIGRSFPPAGRIMVTSPRFRSASSPARRAAR